MDTRQLAAFCAVVDRKSFSLAAEQLGVTQPAVSLQIRSLEKRLGEKLLDRSGRRVEPTEAGQRLYRSAQRMLTLEQQLLEEVSGESDELRGRLEIGCSTGPGATVLPLLLCEFQRENPDVAISLSVNDTLHVIDLVAERRLELGVVGAAPRHRAVTFEPFFQDQIVLAVPPGHKLAGATVKLDDLRAEAVILMQEGAGVRQMVEDELRAGGVRLRDLDVKLELGLQESVKAAVAAGHGVTLHLALVDRAGARGRHPRGGDGRGPGADARDLARPLDGPDAEQGRGGVRRLRARAASRDRPLGAGRAAGRPRGARDRAAVSRCEHALERARSARRGSLGRDPLAPDRRAGRRRRHPRGGRRQCDRHGQGGVVRQWPAARLGPDHVLRIRVDDVLRHPGPEQADGRRRGRRQPDGIVYDPELTLDLPREVTAGTALNALAHAAEALYHPARSPESDRAAHEGAELINGSLPAVLEDVGAIGPRTTLLNGAARAGEALGLAGLCLGHAMAQALGGRYGLPHGAMNALCLPPALRFNEPVVPDAIADFGKSLGAADPADRVEELARLGGFKRLRDFGVPQDELDDVAAATAQRAGAKANPRPASPAQIAELFRQIY